MTSSTDLTELSIEVASRLLRSRQLSVSELTHAHLARIERIDSRVNAFITVTRELALAQANECDAGG